MANEEGELQPIIVKKIKKGGGHHGGAWKVAYADFVTAMMAFFLLMWLLNVTSAEEKNAISNYFDPTHPTVSDSTSGAGGVLGGLSVAPEGAMVTNVQSITSPSPSGSAVNNKSSKKQTGKEKGEYKGEKESKPTKEQAIKKVIEQAKEKLREAEKERLGTAQKALQDAINNDLELAELKDNFVIDITEEGLRIQVIDKEGNPMFASGSARMFEKTKTLLAEVGKVITEQPNSISIRGHTDSSAYGPGASYTNWELSADRANASRRVLLEQGYPADRVLNVIGKADTEHLFPEEPTKAGNRRISIVLLKEEITNPGFDKKAEEEAAEEIQAIQEEDILVEQSESETTEDNSNSNGDNDEVIEYPGLPEPPDIMPDIKSFQKTPGAVEFP